jgi:hypothetical protein
MYQADVSRLRPGLRKKTAKKRRTTNQLAGQDTFPYDVLDEIFCFACENRLQRALDLGTVCRFWYERFVRNDRMWAQLCRAVVKIPRPRKEPSAGDRSPTEWDSYIGVRRAIEVSKQFAPIRPKSLHTINRCNAVDIEDSALKVFSPTSSKITSLHMKFRCPLVLEALTLVEPGVAASVTCATRGCTR